MRGSGGVSPPGGRGGLPGGAAHPTRRARAPFAARTSPLAAFRRPPAAELGQYSGMISRSARRRLLVFGSWPLFGAFSGLQIQISMLSHHSSSAAVSSYQDRKSTRLNSSH